MVGALRGRGSEILGGGDGVWECGFEGGRGWWGRMWEVCCAVGALLGVGVGWLGCLTLGEMGGIGVSVGLLGVSAALE